MRRLIFFVIIIGVLIGIAGYWYWQKNPFSKEILKLEIIGPDKAEVFEEIEYTVKYKNNGDVRLEKPRLVFEFPENTILEEGQARRQEIGPDELEDIYPGEEKTFTFKARLFGKEGDIKTAKAWMYYQPRDLNAVFDSDTTLNTKIESIPLTFDFDLPSKVEAGRDFKFSLNYFSNSEYPISDLGVKTEYPDGFEFMSADPESLADNEWEISLLNKAEGGRIDIEGRLLGDVKDKRVFKAILGLWQNNDFIPLKEISRAVEITRPRLFIFQRINGSDNYTAKSNDSLHYEIFFRNISDEPFRDLFLVVNLESQGFDFNSIKSDNGKFNSGDSSIIWDWRDIPLLRFLDRGEEGKVEFWVDVKDFEISSPQQKNAILKNSVLVSHVKEEFEVKLNSKLEIVQKGYFSAQGGPASGWNEVFGNSGPIPPTVGQPTTYTIIWQAKNYYNALENVTVRANLPHDLELTGNIFPDDQKSNFTFDKRSREIVWRIGDMEAGQGVMNSAPNIAFQVALTPNPSQRGRAVVIIEQAKIRGEDQWTERITEGEALSIDTRLPDDNSISDVEGVVR